jgi:hypothetical protein
MMRSHRTAEPAARIAPNFRVRAVYAERNQETVETDLVSAGSRNQKSKSTSKPGCETNFERPYFRTLELIPVGRNQLDKCPNFLLLSIGGAGDSGNSNCWSLSYVKATSGCFFGGFWGGILIVGFLVVLSFSPTMDYIEV